MEARAVTDSMSLQSFEQPEIQISVVVPTRDRLLELKKCLTALNQQDFPQESYEVIVCDDGSTVDVKTLVLGFAQGGGHWIYLRQNSKGPGAARNLGIRHARGAIVAMTDSDTLPEPNWLTKLWEALAENQTAVAVEGQVYARNEGQYGPLGEGPTNKSGGVYLTCNCAYRREALLKAGGFDESFPFPAYEDTELAARVQQFGPIIWQPEAVVVHPERPLTTRAIIKKLQHWDYVLIMGFRYGYLAWRRYPVRYPRVRVALLATIVLPAAKFRKALVGLGSHPLASLKLALFGLLEAFGAIVLVAPKALFASYSGRIVRRDYLGGLND